MNDEIYLPFIEETGMEIGSEGKREESLGTEERRGAILS